MRWRLGVDCYTLGRARPYQETTAVDYVPDHHSKMCRTGRDQNMGEGSENGF